MEPHSPIDAASAPHYRWGDGCDGWHLVASDALSIIQERMPPHTAETRHRHSRSRQFFFVLDGEAAIEAAGVTHILGPRQGLEIAPGTDHQLFNRSDAELHFLVVSSPPSHGDRTASDGA